MNCRHCNHALGTVLVDLGHSPPSNAYLSSPLAPETSLPLRVLVCDHCWLVQTADYASANDLFSPDYAYFSSYSTSWLEHSKNYVADMVARFGLNTGSCITEVAANDGYLLQYVAERGIPCYGIEPTAAAAKAAKEKGIDIVEAFFGVELAEKLATAGRPADVMVANNVLAHVPDINDFASGFAKLLKPTGVATFEFPHLSTLVSQCLFDTIYHEHFSYLSFTAVRQIFMFSGLRIFDVEKIPTHGGSLRVFAQRLECGIHDTMPSVRDLLDQESRDGVDTPDYYRGFQSRAEKIRDDLLDFINKAESEGKKIAAYGAAAKGNTLLNYCQVNSGQIQFVVDANPHKQNLFMPGSHVPIVDETELRKAKPDYVLVLPWNLMEEIATQIGYIGKWGGKLVRALPSLEILPPDAV